ncbi:MAG: carboxypeptidase regulatory-like domain-containing protein [Terriglobales bacterium]
MNRFAWVTLLVALSCFSFSCKSKDAPPVAHRATKPFTPPGPATASTISGTITFSGGVPPAQKIDMSQDPACGSQVNFDPALAVTDGNLANVFVYIKDGLDDFSFAAPAQPVTITQKACRYQPHIAGALVGQTVEFVNDDETTHNVHMMPREIRQWNESQMPGAAPIEKKFDRPEIMIPVKCNQHPWMRMNLSVVSNPFFAVTGKDGKFSIAGLPPGTYTIAAVHEKLGEHDMKVTVSPKESKVVDFHFKSTP